MKKIIISSLFIMGIFSQNCFGQLKVDSDGHVGIGTNTTTSNFNVGGGGSSDFTSYFAPVSGRKGVNIYNRPDTNNYPLGLYIENGCQGSKTICGIKIYRYGTLLTSGPYYGLISHGGGSTSKNIGIYGGLYSAPTNYGAGIYGSSSTSDLILYPGPFAGYFDGDVRTTGTTYTVLLSPSPSKSTSHTTVLDEDRSGESVTNKLVLLKPTQLIDNTEPKLSVTSEEYKKLAEELGEEIPEDSEPVQTCMSSIRYSIDEESLREVYPELVYEDLDGNVSINYIEMVPLLVQSIKELNAKIEELQGNEGKKISSRSARATSIEDTEADLFTVSQNEPNPFTETTTIKLSIPKKTQKAAFMIYDMSGKQIKQININERGKTSVNITSEGLAAGMYLYSLIADGKVISTKRMILTK